MKGWLFAVLSALLVLSPRIVLAHEVRPGYLEIHQTAPTTYRITWKQPMIGELGVHLKPRMSSDWLESAPVDQYATPGFMIRVWAVSSSTPLEGQTVAVDGLSNTITDVFVRIRPLQGDTVETVLRPAEPSLVIGSTGGKIVSALTLLRLGVEHILSGPDHLLFVLGLILIVRDRLTLLKTVTAFTAAHSLTLAAASFGLITLPPAILEALIALSILFLGPEILRAQRDEVSLAILYPWLVAFAFGLLHGMGFAGGLMSLGLDRSDLLSAVILFNLGVEIGQLAFIAMVLGTMALVKPLKIQWPRLMRVAPAYLVGISGAAWTVERLAAAFGLW